MRRRFLLGCVMLGCAAGGARAQAPAPYLDPKMPVEQRVADLLSRMTLEEKVAQMIGAWENAQFFKRSASAVRGWEGEFSAGARGGADEERASAKFRGRAKTANRERWRNTPTRCRNG